MLHTPGALPGLHVSLCRAVLISRACEDPPLDELCRWGAAFALLPGNMI